MLIALIYTRYSQQYQFPQLCMHLTPQDSLIETQDSNQKQKKMDYHVVLKSTPLSSYSYSLLEFLKNRFHWLFLKDEFCSHYFICSLPFRYKCPSNPQQTVFTQATFSAGHFFAYLQVTLCH